MSFIQSRLELKMTTQSAYSNQKNIFQILDKVAETGVSLEIKRKGKRLIICPAENKLDRLEPHPEFIVGDPDDLVHIDWSTEWKPQL